MAQWARISLVRVWLPSNGSGCLSGVFEVEAGVLSGFAMVSMGSGSSSGSGLLSGSSSSESSEPSESSDSSGSGFGIGSGSGFGLLTGMEGFVGDVNDG